MKSCTFYSVDFSYKTKRLYFDTSTMRPPKRKSQLGLFILIKYRKMFECRLINDYKEVLYTKKLLYQYLTPDF